MNNFYSIDSIKRNGGKIHRSSILVCRIIHGNAIQHTQGAIGVGSSDVKRVDSTSPAPLLIGVESWDLLQYVGNPIGLLGGKLFSFEDRDVLNRWVELSGMR